MKLSLNKLALIAGITILATSCDKKATEPVVVPAASNEVHFNFENYFGDKEIEMNTATYTTAQSEDITISTFNYWISNIVLVNSDGKEFVEEESYRLIRGDKHATMHFHIPDVTEGTYTAVKFMIGVDIPRNTSGAQTGALDPAVNGDMFWSWNTGYIQAKLEGTSPQSTETGNAYEYHIGGVQPGFETPREVTLPFPQGIIVGEQAGSVVIKADAAKWFPTPMPIAMMSSMTHPGENAKKIANNYADMFSIVSVGNE